MAGVALNHELNYLGHETSQQNRLVSKCRDAVITFRPCVQQMRHGATPEADLHELWKRIVFNMLVRNTDDHLRNHGFILVPDKGCSAAYDMNPVPYSEALKLNVSEHDNALDPDLARSVAGYFRFKEQEALAIIDDFRTKIRLLWRPAAKKLGISAKEQRQMASAFRLAE